MIKDFLTYGFPHKLPRIEEKKSLKTKMITYSKRLLNRFEVKSQIFTLFLVFAYLESVGVHSVLDLAACDVVVVKEHQGGDH